MVNHRRYNTFGYVKHISSSKEVCDTIGELHPIVSTTAVNNSFNDSIEKLPKYELHNGLMLENINETENIFIFRNKKHIQELHLQDSHTFPMNELPLSIINVKPSVSLSYMKGKHSITLQRCIHNLNIIETVYGESIIYLFNPKHKEEISNKENYQIKKWGHKLVLRPQTTLFIPPNWYYIQEVDKEAIQYHVDIDNIFTYLPNLLRS